MNDLNEPAFPSQYEGITTAPEYYMGMSLRDYFAAKAMQSLIFKTEPVFQVLIEDDRIIGSTDEVLELHRKGICSSAYEYADAMLEVRKENQ